MWTEQTRTTVALEADVRPRRPTLRPPPGMQPRPDGPVAAFEQERRTLLGIAARIVGSPEEAEDVVQEAFIRWQEVDHGAVQNPAAFLTRVVTRLSINVATAAHRRRMEYVGALVPEPPLDDAPQRDPLAAQEVADELTAAFTLMLERLTPIQRAVFLLHECFGFGYAEIAPIVGKTEENCRQIERRARQRLARRGHAPAVDAAEHDRLLELFLRAARDGEVDQLAGALARGAAEHSTRE